MSYADRIRQATSPQEGLLILAEGIDEVLAARVPTSPDLWGSWGGGGSGTESLPPAAPQPIADVDFYEAKQAAPNPAEVQRATQRIMRLEDMYDRQPTPALLAQLEQAHRALESAENPGFYLDNSGGVVGTGQIDRVTETDDGVVVELPPASPERKAMRRQLAEAIDLPGFFPPIMRSTPQAVEQIIHSYELGGPLWLYANRITPDEHDIFHQLPPAAMQVMVADVAEDDQRQAWEFQRDIMKGEDAEGATLAIAQDNLYGVSAGPNIGLRE